MDLTKSCFVMMPISDQGSYPKGHFTKVYEQILIPAIEDAGYKAYRVDENNICDSIIGKIFDAIQNCPMAICDLSNRNPNVLYELGLRQAYDKPVVLIQDNITDRIFDVSGISTVTYRSERLYEDVIEAREKITQAIIETKEGRSNTLIQMVKATSAIYPKGEISQSDKNEILLQAIMRELYDIKNSTQPSRKIVIYTEEMTVMNQIEIVEREIEEIAKSVGSINEAEAQKMYEKISEIRSKIAYLHIREDEKTALYHRISKIKKTIHKLLI